MAAAASGSRRLRASARRRSFSLSSCVTSRNTALPPTSTATSLASWTLAPPRSASTAARRAGCEGPPQPIHPTDSSVALEGNSVANRAQCSGGWASSCGESDYNTDCAESTRPSTDMCRYVCETKASVVILYLLLLETLQQVVASLLPLRRRAGPFGWFCSHLACHSRIRPVSHPPHGWLELLQSSHVEKVVNILETHPGGSGDAPRCVDVRPRSASFAPLPAALCQPPQTTLCR
jgi:hypothetical protein